MVLGVCRSILHQPHDAEDCFQNVFLILAKRGHTIKHLDTIAPWLHRVALRVARRTRAKSLQRRARELDRVNLATEHRAELVGSHGPAAPSRRDRPVARQVSLPLVLCYLEGKTNQEAARQLSWPVGTVKGRLSRAVSQTLRERLSRRGLDPASDRLPQSRRLLAAADPGR